MESDCGCGKRTRIGTSEYQQERSTREPPRIPGSPLLLGMLADAEIPFCAASDLVNNRHLVPDERTTVVCLEWSLGIARELFLDLEKKYVHVLFIFYLTSK